MARTKNAAIKAFDANKLPAGIVVAQKEQREQIVDAEGNAVLGDDGKPTWNRTLVDVAQLDGKVAGAAIVAFQEYVTKHGPKGYDGNTYVVNALNTLLAKSPIGEEIALAPVPQLVDPLAAVQKRIADAFAAGKPPTQKQLDSWYKEAGLVS